jgi:chemotaxis protein methyltransferase CheR
MKTAPASPGESGSHYLSPGAFEKFSQFITQELGIKMPLDKLSMLQSRLQRRLRALKLESLEEYQEYLFHSPQAASELVDFFDVVTTHKTDFFREPAHFDYLTRVALPTLDPGAGLSGISRPWHFKIWCAGCSSGEEPYTMAMVLSEFALTRPGFDFSILATDISTRVLEHAREAVYDEARVEPVALPLRKKYLLRSRNQELHEVRIIPALRQKVNFRPLNFMDAEYPVADLYEAIFFRNVMIYFPRETQEAVIRKLCARLVPGGYLFVGHSESLTGLKIPVQPLGPAVYRKPL